MDDRTGWVVGKQMEGKDSNKPDKIFGIIKQTTDGGKTWSTQFKELLGKEKTEDGLYKIFFINDKIGWASGYKGTILHTDNGGKAWFNQRAKTKDLYLRGIWFIDSKTGWIIGTFNPEGRWTGIILNTKDGGENWNIQRKIKNTGLTGILFTDKKSGWITGETEDEGGQLFHTTDGGANWLKTNSLHAGTGYPFFYDHNRGILTSKKERIIFTTDSGKTWKQMRRPVRKYPWHVSELFENQAGK